MSNEPGKEIIDLLTPKEVAVFLRVHVYTVYDLLRSGRLAGFQLKKRWRVRRETLEKFVKET